MQGGTASAALPRCEGCLRLRRAYVTKGMLFTMSSCLMRLILSASCSLWILEAIE